MQKFYLHAASYAGGGTMPGASSQSATTPSVTASGAATNRTMNDTIGTLQTSAALTTLAQGTAQLNWFRRFVSPALAAQTITAALNSWSFHVADSESNTNSNFFLTDGVLYLWRPSTGSLVGKLWDLVSSTDFLANQGSSTAETVVNNTLPTTAGTSQTSSDGDVLVFEVWAENTQSMSTAYTNTIFYDGTTEDSATSNAAYLLAPADLTLSAGAVFIPNPERIALQAVNRAANF